MTDASKGMSLNLYSYMVNGYVGVACCTIFCSGGPYIFFKSINAFNVSIMILKFSIKINLKYISLPVTHTNCLLRT